MNTETLELTEITGTAIEAGRTYGRTFETGIIGFCGQDASTLRALTIDSLLADCKNRALHTCRGGRTPGPWQMIEVE